jgi:glycosyltransferase involved in cell wall biosynthesis
VVPARNERGNIRHVIERLPDFGGAEVEVMFVEGHSTDGTWEEIERVVRECQPARAGDALRVAELVRVPGEIARAPTSHEVGDGRHNHQGEDSRRALTVRALRQTGRGKADAVRLGFSQAKGELLTILDADLTTPPEALAEFYDAYCVGRADFINGDRLTLPMERGAMRVMNKWGNRFFAWAVGRVLDAPLGDCLCGTKLLARHDWARFVAWRERFGDRDPFGDFDLLFPAAALAIGSVDLPVRYGARTYGATNIHRFRDGWRLMRMTLAAWWAIRAGAGE